MDGFMTQLNNWTSGLMRYFSITLAQQPLTGKAVLNWAADAFAGGISFTGLSFLLFFPVCVLLFHVVPQKLKNGWLLVCSLFFYYLCTIAKEQAHPEFVVLLLFCILANWLLALLMEKQKPSARRVSLIAGICLDLGILAYYKYLGFFSQIAHSLFPSVFRWDGSSSGIFLPIGISFYMFLSIGYLMDIYRGTRPAERSFINYALFVSFFPQIVSGPIARSEGLLCQLSQKHRYDHLLLNEGLRQMLWGYFKKMVIAGNAAGIADIVFASPARFNGFELFCGMLFYTLQIYADFSGYTDIATGAAKVLGLRLGPNFDRPYFSRSIGEFWDRWHISLSTWFQKYLYIPLGGSRKGTARTCLNLIIVFFLSGLWHGAAYTYIVWGLLHGAVSAVSRLTRGLRKQLRQKLCLHKVPCLHAFLQWLWTFGFVNIAWVFFRSTTLENAFTFIERLSLQFWPTLTDAAARMSSLTYIGFYKNNGPALLWCTLLLFLVEALCRKTPPEKLSGRLIFPVRILLCYGLVLLILFFGVFGASGWIYAAY